MECVQKNQWNPRSTGTFYVDHSGLKSQWPLCLCSPSAGMLLPQIKFDLFELRPSKTDDLS